MQKTDNILSPIVDVFTLTADLIYGIFFKPKYRPKVEKFDIFFESVGIKNKLGKYPQYMTSKKEGDKIIHSFSLPLGLTVKDFESKLDVFEQVLGNKVKFMVFNQKILVVEYLNKLQNKYKYELPNIQDKLNFKIPIGKSIEGTQYLNLKENPHTLICGATGSGKSVCSKSILTSLLNMYGESEAEFYLIDFKVVELALFKKCKQVKGYEFEPKEAIKIIEYLLAETLERYALFESYNVTNIYDYNKENPKNKLKFKFLFVEEFVMLTEHKKGIQTLKKLICLCRACGIHIFISCQRPCNLTLDNTIKANLGNRLVFKVEDTKNSIIALDREGAETLRGNGHCLYKHSGDVTEIQGFYIDDVTIRNHIQKYYKQEIKPIEQKIQEKQTESNNKQIKKAPATIKDTSAYKVKSNILKDLSILDKL